MQHIIIHSAVKGEFKIKTIKTEAITEAVAQLCKEANFQLGQDMIDALKKGHDEEISLTGKNIFNQLLQNARIAREESVPICQDTGFAVVFVELGQDVNVEGGNLYRAINEGVRKGYTDGYLRKSIVSHPIDRVNTGDNTPAIIHLEMVAGENIKITVAPKGGGGENMSTLKMLKPAEGVEGVKNFVLETVSLAGPNPCPPIVLGVGIGGTFEKAAFLAKKALLRPAGSPNGLPDIADLEMDLLDAINKTGIGPQGFGGRMTALSVNIEIFPTHIACLPVAVNINCHASRHKSCVL